MENLRHGDGTLLNVLGPEVADRWPKCPDNDVVDVVLDGIGARGDPDEVADGGGGEREQSVHCQLPVAHYPPSLEYHPTVESEHKFTDSIISSTTNKTKVYLLYTQNLLS